MALRDQPYLPLYVDDFLSDEKLILCSANSYGVYINIMCLMHKSETYGIILLDQKWKQNDNQIINFAYKFAKILPFTYDEILSALSELIYEKVLCITGDQLIQKRMVRDNEISVIRAEAGSKGGKISQFAKANIEASANTFALAKDEANTVIVNDNVIVNDIELKEGVSKKNYDAFIELFNRICNKKFRGTSKDKAQFHARTKEGFTIDDFETAIVNCRKDKYHIENPQYLTPEFITRADKLQKFLNFTQKSILTTEYKNSLR